MSIETFQGEGAIVATMKPEGEAYADMAKLPDKGKPEAQISTLDHLADRFFKSRVDPGRRFHSL